MIGICFICQGRDKSNLRSTDSGIQSLASNLKEFWRLDALYLEWEPSAVLYNCAPEFHECLKENQAKYHKSCANGYDKQKLQRSVDNKA